MDIIDRQVTHTFWYTSATAIATTATADTTAPPAAAANATAAIATAAAIITATAGPAAAPLLNCSTTATDTFDDYRHNITASAQQRVALLSATRYC